MKITVAIPNYEMGDTLGLLVQQLTQENFDAIYVLDDASKQDTAGRLGDMATKINLITGDQNIGAGGNRNRIIGYINDGLILFIDADMKLVSTNIRASIEQLFKDEKVGIAGLKIITNEDVPMQWNFGGEMHPVKEKVAEAIVERAKTDDEYADWAYENEDLYFRGWNPQKRDLPSQLVDWCAEGAFVIRAKLFAEISGYDTQMHYHETHDLSLRVRQLGYKVLFFSNIVAQHLEVKLDGIDRRVTTGLAAEAYFYKKHYGLSEEAFQWLKNGTNEKQIK